MDYNKHKQTKKISIDPLHTYFIEWDQQYKCNLEITLIKGTAEILGEQLMILSKIQISPSSSISIFTWEGCQIEYSSQIQLSNQIGTDLTTLHQGNRQSPMIFYMNLHYNLTKARRLALQNNTFGPRVMVIGEHKNEKIDIIRVLINYATKINMEPIYVDLDLQNSIFCDGCIGASHIKNKFPKNFIQYDNKIAFFYGTTKIYKKSYFTLMQSLSKSTIAKMNKQIKVNKQRGIVQEYPNFCSGLIVNVPYLKKLSGALQKQIIQEIIKQFDITHALVIQDTTSLAYLNKQHPKIQRSSAPKLLQGIKSENTKLNNKIEIYFNGSTQSGFIFRRDVNLELSNVNIYELRVSQEKPYCVKLDLNEMQIVKEYITILHTKNDTVDEYQLGQKALTSPICCLAKIHSIQNGKLVLQVLNEQFLEMYKNNLWLYGKLSDK